MKKKNKGRTKNKIVHEKFKDLNITLLDEHQRSGRKLLSPFTKLEDKIQKTSWADNALNEVLWAAILCGNMNQKDCLELFRALIINARENVVERKETFITHSALSVLSEELFDQLMEPILKNEDAKKLLSGLLYFECLPDRKHWLRHLNNPANQNSHSEIVMKGVAKCLDHQSQESTDIRWLKVMHVIIAQERAFFPETMTEELEGLRLYPDYGDQRSVRPSIRAMELSYRACHNNSNIPFEIPKELKDKIPAPWNNDFWKECYSKTECITQNIKKPEPPKKSEYFDQFFNTYHQLAEYFIESAESTDIDAKRDACFGIVLYSLYLGLGLASSTIPLAQRAEGRMTLRTIVENFITLKYLEHKDDPTIWMKFRSYGTGKSKMVFLKNIQQEEIPSFINLQDLHNYANEDMWQEFSDMDFQNWDKNLRSLAEEAGIKDFYDKHYDWSSGYVHGNWGAIRDTVFTVCLNPLHRFHRIPFLPRFDMPSVLPDIAKAINVMLGVIDRFYPTFKLRIKHSQEDKKPY